MCGRVSLLRTPKKPLCEAKAWIVLETPKCWRCQSYDIFDKWKQLKIEKCVAVSKSERMEPSKSLDTQQRATGFEVCPDGFCIALNHYFIIFPFGIVMYIMCHFILEAV